MVLKAHFSPKTLVVAERFRFYRRNQGPEENVADFIVALRKLATKCDFGEILNDALRDRVVCGIRDENTQKRLLSEATLTLNSAVDLAQSLESAGKQVKKLKEPSQAIAGPVFNVKPSGSANLYSSNPTPSNPTPSAGKSRTPCYRCGRKHPGTPCRFKDATCHRCGKPQFVGQRRGSPSPRENRVLQSLSTRWRPLPLVAKTLLRMM